MRLPCRRVLPLIALTSLAVAQGGPPWDAPDKTPSDFVRYVKVGEGGHLDTAITTYKKGDVEVVLFGAVHIADQACYDVLNDRFTVCDALLYELVAPADYRPTKDRETGFNPLSLLQQGMRNSMELTFQLDIIDYSATNFVHADMTPQEFQSSMAERGESLMSIMFEMMMNGMKMQRAQAENAESAPAPEFDLVKAFRSGEGRHLLRVTLAAQLEEIEMLAAGAKEGGSTLLEGRNEKCLEVMQREIAAGKKKLGVYYGAAHLPHMERRLVEDLGFKKTNHEWLVAWDCAPRPDPKYDRALIKLRQQCRKELAVLALAAREYRLAAGGEGVPTVQQISAKPAGGEAHYTGPLQDPWGNVYVVQKRKAGVRWQAVSAGQDGQFGTDDDMIEQEPRRGGLRIW